ncbi:RNB domain-containing ribonuclease [Pseudolysinimonas yzui]|uniref:Ribonuclease R n=1 Tax=Pseudolysinimonas yzui TaxID=2708254 RepID=A0A8J3GNJ6_9MICO|nr:RNB domain-containing ribonuclease [Pseudolysinimonas yzui]GHF07703.1 ribonuclease R [Pseudolysinimonas yzui]
MPSVPLKLTREASQPELVAALAAIRAELELPSGFPAEVSAEAGRAVDAYEPPDLDLTDLPFVTIDPAGATDLDQALAIEPDGAGWRVFYAIADLPGFVAPGGAIDDEARERGQTLYAADGRIPLHPVTISEGAASLLPDVERGAFVWELQLDASGRQTSARVRRARVRSRRQWSYEDAQAAVAGDPMLGMLRDVGEARIAQESERGGASLSTPEILVVREGREYRLERRVVLPVATWNAQISLLTGMAAARMMLDAGVGILRTMPPAEPEAIERFRRRTIALGTPWAEAERYGDYLRRLDNDEPRQIAIRHAAASLFRGAAYAPFDGAPPSESVQAAIGAPYAHVTAPLRRLVDRFGLEVCLAVSGGTDVPAWVREALPLLPAAMGRSTNTAGRLGRRMLDTVEAAVLAPHVGEVFDALAITDATVQLVEPAVEAACDGSPEPGSHVRVRLVEADIATGTVRFRVS